MVRIRIRVGIMGQRVKFGVRVRVRVLVVVRVMVGVRLTRTRDPNPNHNSKPSNSEKFKIQKLRNVGESVEAPGLCVESAEIQSTQLDSNKDRSTLQMQLFIRQSFCDRTVQMF